MNIQIMKRLCLAGSMALWLITGTGAALAQDSKPSQDLCEGYYIEGGTFDSLNLEGVSCYLQQVTINGDLTVYNAENFTIQNSNVSGSIKVISSGDVRINDTDAESVVVTQSEKVEVSLVKAPIHIKVINNAYALVFLTASDFINCTGNIRLIGFDNQSNRGTNCSPFAALAPAEPQ